MDLNHEKKNQGLKSRDALPLNECVFAIAYFVLYSA